MVESKQVRVDNWGIFFLQRLQLFFSKTDFCDLTLQFQGNVQLKVHRLVMNACTEYFHSLENDAMGESIIIMPPELQAEVMVPIVNFMYTGLLDFHVSIYDKLYKAAEIMNISVLTKLLEAQKIPSTTINRTTTKPQPMVKKVKSYRDLPSPLPGRKLPVWKRKSAPSPQVHSVSQLVYPDTKWTPDPLQLPDNTPKPTRFEWPDDEIPTLNLMDTSFEDISYTSKPLLTQEEEIRAGTSFDDIKSIPNAQRVRTTSSSSSGKKNPLDIDEMADLIKEQKIRSELGTFDEDDQDVDNYEVEEEVREKRKPEPAAISPKRIKLSEKEKEATISITTSKGSGADLDHTKIIAEILKKYPHLVKKNKNIRLKIMAAGKEQKVTKAPVKIQVSTQKSQDPLKEDKKSVDEGPWTCSKCEAAGDPQEFVLYYLYRKHMTDVHNEKFDSSLCKYCGHKCSKTNLLHYHLYTKHGMKPPANFKFPKCEHCPYIALSPAILACHQQRHNDNEMQCADCHLAFTSNETITSHMQITGHMNKPLRFSKTRFDCQYCMKKYQTAVNLFSHIKNSHMAEARRDGIVSLDEIDSGDELEELENQINKVDNKKKVKILSDVKINDEVKVEGTDGAAPLEPSSEAEALSNVASGIATSLGLVDIVVLDDNQQYILQQQQSQSSLSGEYEDSQYNSISQQFYNTQGTVLPQAIMQSSSSDIASTDELVMVLTDHDYPDGQVEVNSDNSNIVVLYSHPVDGQGQFITSQDNLMVNSQTGMLEIRNGATIATSSATGGIVVNEPEDNHIESIEMIQREIDSHTDKQEQFYQEHKLNLQQEGLQSDEIMLKQEEQSQEVGEGEGQTAVEAQTDEVDAPKEIPDMEPMEVDEDVELQPPEKLSDLPPDELTEAELEKGRLEALEEGSQKNNLPTTEVQAENDGEDVPPEVRETKDENEVEEKEEQSAPEALPENDTVQDEIKDYVPEAMEVDGKVKNQDTVINESQEEKIDLIDSVENSKELVEEDSQETKDNLEEALASESQPEEGLESEASLTQFNDENSQSSQGSQSVGEKSQSGSNKSTAKISILDDWEDTDSQQSEQRGSVKECGETVDKLMDDWDEEDEDEKKLAADSV